MFRLITITNLKIFGRQHYKSNVQLTVYR